MSKKITLTTPFDLDDYAEFSAAVEVLGHRSLNAFVHQLVMQKIREAKNLVSSEEFAEIVRAQKESIGKRSQRKTKERVEVLGRLAAETRLERPLLEVGELASKKAKPKKKKVA